MPKGFVYNSTQEHLTVVRGKPVGHSTHITIKNGIGRKQCIQYNKDGTRKIITKKLTGPEMGAIRRKEYLPALFKGAMESLRLGKPLSWICGSSSKVRSTKTKKNRRRQ
jgi:hypothetical protein